MSKYTEMKASYEERIKELTDAYEKHDKYLQGECGALRLKLCGAKSDQAAAHAKIELYEQIISKLLDERKNATDMFFMLEGKLYRPVEHTLSKEGSGYKSQPASLSVEFVEVPTDFKKGE